MTRLCPVCGNSLFAPAVSEEAVRHEIQTREQFICLRTPCDGPKTELKDLLDFMHGMPAALESCIECGTLVRLEADSRSGAYEEDPNDPAFMAHVYPRYVAAFRAKEPAYRDRLPPHADVVELGSHLGAFLQVAEEWNWTPVGLDIGEDTSAFARSFGFTVYRKTIEDARLASRSLDAICIWNCFEQIDDPAPVLKAAHRLLKRNGLLIIRVPNAEAYRILRNNADRFSERALAYNNLLGFPYLYGYTAASLSYLVSSWGFTPVQGFNSELVTMPFPELRNEVGEEQRRTSRETAHRTALAGNRLTGPWMELIFRKVEQQIGVSHFDIDAHLLPRA